MGTPWCWMINICASSIADSFVHKWLRTPRARLPRAQLIVPQNLLIDPFSLCIVGGTAVRARSPCTSIRARQGAPWCVVVSCCAANNMHTLVVELRHTTNAKIPFTLVLVRRQHRAWTCITVVDTRTPIILAGWVIAMLAPRRLMINSRTAGRILDTLPLKLWSALWDRLPLASTTSRNGRSWHVGARTCKLALRIRPSTNVTCIVPCCFHIGNVITVLVCYITLECCPRFLLGARFVSYEQRCQRPANVSQDERESLTIPSTSC
jgi:hypothetical protein